jgi:signal transduction histidine kinase
VIGAVLDEVMISIRPSLTEKALGFSVDLPQDLSSVNADPMRLNQILANLIGNAVKYTRPGGQIHVTVEEVSQHRFANGQVRPDRFVQCVVRDSGVGISPEDQRCLFQRFYRGNHPYVREQPGTGLGLSITRRLVEMHGGTIWVESELEEGSSFAFTLPTADGELA